MVNHPQPKPVVVDISVSKLREELPEIIDRIRLQDWQYRLTRNGKHLRIVLKSEDPVDIS